MSKGPLSKRMQDLDLRPRAGFKPVSQVLESNPDSLPQNVRDLWANAQNLLTSSPPSVVASEMSDPDTSAKKL